MDVLNVEQDGFVVLGLTVHPESEEFLCPLGLFVEMELIYMNQELHYVLVDIIVMLELHRYTI